VAEGPYTEVRFPGETVVVVGPYSQVAPRFRELGCECECEGGYVPVDVEAIKAIYREGTDPKPRVFKEPRTLNLANVLSLRPYELL
jgi:hypothetical protein